MAFKSLSYGWYSVSGEESHLVKLSAEMLLYSLLLACVDWSTSQKSIAALLCEFSGRVRMSGYSFPILSNQVSGCTVVPGRSGMASFMIITKLAAGAAAMPERDGPPTHSRAASKTKLQCGQSHV